MVAPREEKKEPKRPVRTERAEPAGSRKGVDVPDEVKEVEKELQKSEGGEGLQLGTGAPAVGARGKTEPVDGDELVRKQKEVGQDRANDVPRFT